MRIGTNPSPSPILLPPYTLQFVTIDHSVPLAHLMDIAYRGTIDHEGETLDQCIEEIRSTIEGKYGPLMGRASLFIEKDGRPVSALLTTLWKGSPLIAYTMTDPDHRGGGLARFLIGKAMAALHEASQPKLFLVVTEGNLAAERLYEKMGFAKAGLALPGTPPPQV